MAIYGIMAHRSAGSMFGAASAPLKSNGEVVTYTTREEAQAEVDRLNKLVGSAHVHYTVTLREHSDAVAAEYTAAKWHFDRIRSAAPDEVQAIRDRFSKALDAKYAEAFPNGD